MKTNPELHNKIGFQNPAQKVWYAAHVLLAASTNSPAIIVRSASPAVAAKPAVIAQTAKPARAATPAILGTANTTGYAFGELYLNSPAYPAGTAIPAISAKPASAAISALSAVAAVAAVAAVSSPAVVAIKGYEDAITITQSATQLTVVAELPAYTGVGIVGSNKLVIGEITPSTLQATAFLQDPVYSLGQNASTADNLSDTTLEQVLYRNALLCDHAIVDIVRDVNGANISCKRITVTLYPSTQFDADSDLLQLSDVRMTANTGS